MTQSLPLTCKLGTNSSRSNRFGKGFFNTHRQKHNTPLGGNGFSLANLFIFSMLSGQKRQEFLPIEAISFCGSFL